MAVDTLLMELATYNDAVVWRPYGWSEQAMTFGYSQRFASVRELMKPFPGPLVRRITGGGVVDHRRDFTYALALPASHPLHREKAAVLYRDLHTGLSELLNAMGMETRLLPCHRGCEATPAPPATGICFRNPEPYDILHLPSGTKVAGAAMKRTREALLIEGSLRADIEGFPDTEELSPAIAGFLVEWLKTGSPAGLPLPSSTQLAAEVRRFSSREWNARR